MTASVPGPVGPVVLGVGDPSDLTSAAPWASREARLRGVPLRVVSAYHWAALFPWEFAHRVRVPELEDMRVATEQMVTDVVREIRRADPELEVLVDVVHGTPAETLIAASESASVLVVGSRELGAHGSLFPGRTGAVAAARAACPTVVVRGTSSPPADPEQVVVGVDASDATEPVLGFAFDEASRTGLPLHAVLCWRPDLLAEMSWRDPVSAPDRAARWLAESLAGWQEKYPDVAVEHGVVRDHAVSGLVAASYGQRLLVVGAAGRPALAGTVLGSVSQGVLHNATCPVAVVPAHHA